MKQIIPFISNSDNDTQTEWLSSLRQAMPNYRILPFAELTSHDKTESTVAIVANPSIAEVDQLPNLKWVQSLWAGVENLVKSELDMSVKIVKLTDERLSQTMVEAAIASTFYLHREIPVYRRQQIVGEWSQRPVALASERTVGVLGLGALGACVANQLATLNFNVFGWSRSVRSCEKGDNAPEVECFHGQNGLMEVLRRSEILIVLLPLTQETHGLLDTKKLSVLPKGASVINFARGPIVVEQDLLGLLDSDHLNHAVLDVFDHEPLEPSHAFWQHKQITVWPHIAAPTDKRSASRIVAINLDKYFVVDEIPRAIDREREY